MKTRTEFLLVGFMIGIASANFFIVSDNPGDAMFWLGILSGIASSTLLLAGFVKRQSFVSSSKKKKELYGSAILMLVSGMMLMKSGWGFIPMMIIAIIPLVFSIFIFTAAIRKKESPSSDN